MQQEYNYTPLPEPIPITEQVWPEGTLPLVCTSTLAYNHEPYIRECLDGILMQKTTFPVQVLVHEDCSTDRTAEILKEYQAKYPNLIKVFYQPENVYSLKDQEEKRKRRAEFNSWRTGKYIALCEGDDYWIDPLKLQKQVDFLEENEEYSMCSSAYIARKQDGEMSEVTLSTMNKTFNLFTAGYWTKTLTVVFKKDMLFRYFQDANKYSFTRDLHLWYYLLKEGNGFYFSEVFGVYNLHKGGICSLISLEQRSIDSYNVRKELYYVNKDKFTRISYISSLKSILKLNTNGFNRFNITIEALRISRSIKDTISIILYYLKIR